MFSYKIAKEEINDLLTKQFGVSDLILNISNAQVFLNHEKINNGALDFSKIQDVIIRNLLNYKGIDKVFAASTIHNGAFNNGVELLLANGYNQKHSGDILIVLNASMLTDTFWNKTGTDHGSGYNYDTHVPLLFFGKGVKHGSTIQKTNITDIAPTISSLLGISFPNGATGVPLEFIMK